MSKKLNATIPAIFVFLLLASISLAGLKLAPLFTDHMVLQQNSLVPIWGTAEAGTEISVQLGWNDELRQKTTADDNGKWMLKIQTPPAGGPYTLIVTAQETLTLKDVLIGEVWLCSGQSNMQYGLKGSKNGALALEDSQKYPQIRLFRVGLKTAPIPDEFCEGNWQASDPASAMGFSAVGYYFGKQLNQKLNVPIGLIQSAWGGTPAEAWTPLQYMEDNPALKPILERHKDTESKVPQAKKKYEKTLQDWEKEVEKAKSEGKTIPTKPYPPGPLRKQLWPSYLYNGMIAPVDPFGIRGVIWYQGESNVSRHDEYKNLFSTMIKSWRDSFNQLQLPFYFVQIAPFSYNAPEGANAALLREAQLKTLQTVPDTGMAVITDLAPDVNDVHPAEKEPVGKRLALWAMAKIYGKDVVYSGPIYKSMKIEDNKIRISFDHIGEGLISKEGELSHFQIAGVDKKFYPSKAIIDGDTIVVHSSDVKSPVAVRFGFTNIATPNLFNKSGLPASPFRTDDWSIE